MLRNFFVLVIVTSFGLFLYGIKNVYHDVEPNACRMTYMFAQPQFSRVYIEDAKKFPNYGVYYYHEGPFSKNVNKLKLSGAPVIFVPGNGGSLKQVRSLASVALRKSIDSKSDIKLDYFTIDYNEELSGVYGQYLPDQVKFLEVSIKAVLKLYKDAYTDERKVVLIGHSMGGKIAQTVITNPDIASKINSVICISSPLDLPVIKLDASTQDFYESAEANMSKIRTSYLPSDKTNHCCNKTSINLKGFDKTQTTSTKDVVQNILFVSIGGGNRDVLVREGLTTSKYSDIHALTASIPKVWLSCDHLSSVWCLQLMLVVNRFLFDISKVFEFKYTLFKEDWNTRLRAANNHFRVGRTTSRRTQLQKIEFDDDIPHIVHEDSRRIYGRQVPNDSKKFYNEIFQLKKLGKYRKLYIDVFNYEKNDWLYGCSPNSDDTKSKICSNASSLSHYIEEIPSKGRVRSIARLDIQSIKKTYTNWSHLVIRLPPSTKHVYFNVDIHEPSVRYFEIAAPRWYSMKNHIVVNESVHGTIHYKLHFQGLTESFLGLKVMIEPQACLQKSFSLTTKMCVPWAYGFDKYQVLSESTPAHIFVAVPFSPPKNYNASKNPVDFDIFLDPACRFRISYSFSMAHTMSRIFKEYYSWLPAHIVSVLIIVLKNQMATLAKAGSKKSPFPYSGFFQFKSIYIITGCRVVKKLITPIEFLPTTSDTSNSYYVLAIVHSTAIVLSIMIAFLLWAVTLCNSNLWHRFMLRLTRITFINSNILMVALNQLPMAVGVVTVSIAFGACSGVALFFACGFYLITLSSAHKDYLEKWVWKKATNLLKGKRNTQVEQQSTESENLNEATEKDESKDGNGLSHFSFYFVIFLLLLVIALINIPMTIAWVKNRSSTVVLPDSALFSTILILCSLAILHQLNAPNELILNKLVAVFLYAAASASVLFCQQEIHRLNNVVAFVLVVLAVQEVLGGIYRYCIKK